MKIDIEFAELHSPLFLAGTNLQLKLDPSRRTGLSVVYDRAEKELIVSYNGKQAIVPISNVSSMTPAPVQTYVLQEPIPELARPKVVKATAQVSTPQSHVFAGEGHGQTGQEPRGKVVL